MTESDAIIQSIEKHGACAYGRNEYIRTLKGERVSPTAAILAQCYSCSAYYEDEKADCGINTCPLYGWMPYGTGKDKRPKRVLSETTKKALAEAQARKRLSKQNNPSPET